MLAPEQTIKFPCEFPVKVMGLNTEEFSQAVIAVFRNHMTPAEFKCETKLSSNNKYLSITVTFMAKNRKQLDAIYQELNDHELVMMTL